MKYFSYQATKEEFLHIQKELSFYCEWSPSQHEVVDSTSLASYVFDRSQSLLPQELKALFEYNSKWSEIFKKDMLQHLIFTTSISHEITTQSLKSHTSYFRELQTRLKVFHNSQTIEDTHNFFRHITKKTMPYLRIPLLEYEGNRKRSQKKYDTPKSLAFFIGFIAYHNSQHKFFGNKINTKSQLQEIKEYQEIFSTLISDMSDSDKELNSYLFEREYSTNLTNKLLSIDNNIFIDHINAKKILCLLELLPNIKGRIFLTDLLIKYKEIISHPNLHPNFGTVSYAMLNGTYEQEHERTIYSRRMDEAKWFIQAPLIILQLALFYIPYLELLHNYFYSLLTPKNFNIQFSEPNKCVKMSELFPVHTSEDYNLEEYNLLKKTRYDIDKKVNSENFKNQFHKQPRTRSVGPFSPYYEERKITYLEPSIEAVLPELMEAIDIPF
ncbi:hypothetical protein PTI45_02049 [Paenibacillus nuruki]|uniref:Uncharacterized protein n=1 Tax=Paenibacillus nuruki TaxID=1886670 RepID=A0A1E3L498_9BACL|nr:hypothetical protein [Paenibacillus nuruki]ODP28504.1 hypothetical protein PTI45_02049 [Paenibacillus nuruki]